MNTRQNTQTDKISSVGNKRRFKTPINNDARKKLFTPVRKKTYTDKKKEGLTIFDQADMF